MLLENEHSITSLYEINYPHMCFPLVNRTNLNELLFILRE